jgi:hypothetical protein
MSRSVWQSAKTGRDYGSPTPFEAERSLSRIWFSSDSSEQVTDYLRLECASVLLAKTL